SMHGLAQTVDNQHVITHQRRTITCNPAKGIQSYSAWGVFPSEAASVRKILMHVTLGTPDSLSTAHWDYCDHINILKTGGKKGKDHHLEIGRMLTPYGSIYSKGWEFTWSVDVTDFALLLRDSVQIEYVHSGYEPRSVGWALTVDFEITAGPPHIHPLSIQPMWNGSYNYGNAEKPIEKELMPMDYSPVEGSVLNRLRIQHTGHGMDSPKGCSEFCSRWRDIVFNGDLVQHKDLWKNCGDNPLYPQGGTWIFDRALWCPGDLQQPDIIDVYPSAGKQTFNIEMEPYTATDNVQAKEDIASCLIHYSAPVSPHDVALEEIITPNQHPFYNRTNPACFDAKIKIRNLGREDLNSLIIVYGTEGFKKNTFKWKGNLPYYAAETITLPGIINCAGSMNTFSVECRKPNGKKDAWKGDNSLSSTFQRPQELPEDLIVQLRTNARPNENSVFILDNSGDTLYQKKPGLLEPETIYTDSIHLPKGAYEMFLTDSAGNGLEFWFMKQQGYGYLRLLDTQGHLLHRFESDCGDGEKLAFITDPDYKKDTCESLYDFILFPKRITDTFMLEVYAEKTADIEVIVMTLGVPVEKHYYSNVNGGTFHYDISHLPNGRYIVEVLIDGKREYKARINKDSSPSDW
ncbi:MAG: peptide-N-glycosidase, partial [Marinilabiliaceae bacterium]|nr:peptide-N-glycosidase [Marinilabiliaceae bacterium]